MLVILCMLFVGGEKIILAGNDAPVPFNDHIVMVENGFIGWRYDRLWHWARDGKLMRTMGGKGEGPGEFNGLSAVLWDGDYYWCVDGDRSESTVFKKDGAFFFRQNLYFRWYMPVGSRLFVVDHSRLNVKMVEQQMSYPPFIRELSYHIDAENRKIVVDHLGTHFRKATRKQALSGGYSFKIHWMVPYKNGWYVANQVENLIWFYDEATIRGEASLPDERKSTVRPYTLRLSQWESDSGWHPEKGRKWWYKQSRLNGLYRDRARLVVGHLVPNVNYSGHLQKVEIFHLDKLGPSFQQFSFDGALIGTGDGYLYTWEINDDGAGVITKTVIP